MSALDRTTHAFHTRWGSPDLVVRAPGRVNLIGEHTDYNDGFTMPMALPFDTVIALGEHGDPESGTVTISSEGFGDVEFDPAGDPTRVVGWARHLAGVVSLLGERGIPAGGWRACVSTDIPTGASLSSSAAIEVAAITAMLARADVTWPPIEVAKLGQRVENEVVGLQSGIMDQFISAGAVAGHASLMDCRALTLDHRRMPASAVVAVLDTGTRRVLAEVAYDDRRRSCERAARSIGVAALRDAEFGDLDRVDDPTDRRRALHIITENQRTLDAAEALASDDVERFGALMNASHVSLRDDFEVSGPGLDLIVEAAQASPGCLGARMTGGGFAGCAVALVAADEIDRFTESVTRLYRYLDQAATVWICRPEAGASVIER